MKNQIPLFYLAAESRYRADSYTAITQLTRYISSTFSEQLTSQIYSQRWDALGAAHAERLAAIAEAAKPKEDGSFGTGHLCQVLRRIVPKDSIFAIEAVTNTAFVADNIQATLPGSWINCGGGGLGWSGGGTLGIKLASEYENPGRGKFVVQIVGDGTFLFCVPGSVYWISQRYKIPVLTIVLNNNGKKTRDCSERANCEQAGMPLGNPSCSSTRMGWGLRPRMRS
jgi:thiamine pyrophosphate-dependent acetolactate synthase large subunit-like protein